MLNDAVSLGTGGAIAVVGLSGVVLVSRDGGKSFALMQQRDRKGLSAARAVGGDTLVVVGEGGARRINIAPIAAMMPGGAGMPARLVSGTRMPAASVGDSLPGSR
jgi:photosystem II stability/assembly factor-like uncharacterized protein